MFSHDRANVPESKTVHMFRSVRQVAAPVGRHTLLFGRIRQGGGTGGEVCRLRLHLVFAIDPRISLIIFIRIYCMLYMYMQWNALCTIVKNVNFEFS